MRHQYTPIFRDLLTSSLWASATPATRCVWLALLLLADPEGYVPAAIPGLALAANVSDEEAREAVALLEAPDPDSRTADHDGRRIAKVPRGWLILNFVEWRARAVYESEKARKRAWARTHRQPANDNDVADESLLVATSSGSSETLDAPKPKPIPKPDLSSEGEILPLVLHELPADWELSDELRAAATIDCVPDIDKRIAELRLGPIGGKRGVLAHQLDSYVRQQFGKWKTWSETERAKAQRDAQAPPGRAFGGRGQPAPLLEPSAKHRAFAAKYGIDIDGEVRRMNEANIVDSLGLIGARQNLEAALTRLAKEKARARRAL